uniref:Spherulin 4-like cell surface protein n=1 Tax=Mycena chlorophos TaxID=658473 RepID=A0ABQ0LC73_MYCCL|nr:predicted protein [Mycena chlorophos]
MRLEYALYLFFFLSPVRGLGVLLPLYVDPNDSCSAWQPVFSAISAYPNIPWYIIINPDNGPGSADATYQSCVASLPTASSRTILGYVDSSQESSTVTGNIAAYSSWPTSVRPTGIFFDQVQAGDSSAYQNYVSAARNAGFSFVALDPGEAVDPSYTSLADLVNTYESGYSSFSSSSIGGTLPKQSVTLVNAPSTGSYSYMISELESMGVGAVYITDQSDDSPALPNQLSEWVAEIAAGSGSSSTHGTTFATTAEIGAPTSTVSDGGSTTGGNASGSESSSALEGSPSSPDGSGPSGNSAGPSTSVNPSLAAGAISSATAADGSSSSSSTTEPGSAQSPPGSVSDLRTIVIGAIVGGIIGGLLVIAFVLWLLRRRRRLRTPLSSLTMGPISAFTDTRTGARISKMALEHGDLRPEFGTSRPETEMQTEVSYMDLTGTTSSFAPVGAVLGRRWSRELSISTDPPPSYQA